MHIIIINKVDTLIRIEMSVTAEVTLEWVVVGQMACHL